MRRQALEIQRTKRRLCKEMSGATTDLVAAFGIPEHLLDAPICGDWEKYNETDNRGEVAAPWTPARPV
eukprot:scaffold203_cov386-Prasinococcus_capsulatus_cf.AAC.22